VANRIEIAKSGRSKCVTCNEVILKGTPRLSEEYNDIGIPDLIHRYYHLKCAAAVHPEIVHAALAHVDEGVDFDREEIEAKIAPAVARAAEQRKEKYLAQQAEKDAKTKLVIVEADEVTSKLLAQLDGAPEDPGTLAVVADQLQARGDIRGELIALQLTPTAAPLSLEGDDDEETDAEERTSETQRRSQRVAELTEKLTIPVDAGDKLVWGVGFIRRLELIGKNGTRLAALEPIWKHPSLRFLVELKLTFSSNLDTGYIARMHEYVPHSLRRLEIGDDGSQALAGLPAFIAQLPRLEVLAIGGKAWTSRKEPLVHPTLKRLELGLEQRSSSSDLPNLLPFLAAKSLPAVDTIMIRPGQAVIDEMYRMDTLGHVATSLAAKGWFKKPLHLGWVHAQNALALSDVSQLAEALGKKKLARLDLTGTKVPLALRDKLVALTAELVAPELEIPGDATLYIEHSAKPEWGRGKVVSRKDGKVEVDFGRKIGKKVFKADAPFLKLLA
jgi:Protein of unknown function (DUF3553)